MNKKIKNLLLIILSVAALAAVSGCGTKNTPTPADNGRNNNAATSTPTADNNGNKNEDIASSTDEIDTTDWKTYRNKEYGFGVKYPKEWGYEKKVYKDENGNTEDIGLVLRFYNNKTHYFDFSARTLGNAKNLDKIYHYEPSHPLIPMYYKDSPYFSFMSSKKWEYEKMLFEGSGNKESCKREFNYLICYDYNLEGDFLNRYDIIYNKGVRYEFIYGLAGGIVTKELEDFSSENINKKANERIVNKFILDEFTEEDNNNIRLIEKIKENLSFID